MPGSRLRWVIVGVTVAILVGVAVPVSATYLLGGSHSSPKPCLSPEPNFAVLSQVTFTEKGLPLGTLWSLYVEFNASNATFYRSNSTTANIGFELPEGIFSFTVENVSNATEEYAPDPATGCATTTGVDLGIGVTFGAEALVPLSFHESGLPPSFGWDVSILGGPSVRMSAGSANSTITFPVPAGRYNYTVQNVTDSVSYYAPSTPEGSVAVARAAVTVDVTFFQIPAFPLVFAESGLPAGTDWGVGLRLSSGEGIGTDSPSNEIVFSVPNGSYNFTINDAFLGDSRYVPTPGSGTARMDGSEILVSVNFTWVATFNVTFEESGLPAGAVWSAIVVSPAIDNQSTTGEYVGENIVIDLLPNGSYNFSILPPSGYTASPPTGTFTLDGANLTIDVDFTE